MEIRRVSSFSSSLIFTSLVLKHTREIHAWWTSICTWYVHPVLSYAWRQRPEYDPVRCAVRICRFEAMYPSLCKHRCKGDRSRGRCSENQSIRNADPWDVQINVRQWHDESKMKPAWMKRCQSLCLPEEFYTNLEFSNIWSPNRLDTIWRPTYTQSKRMANKNTEISRFYLTDSGAMTDDSLRNVPVTSSV